jgi:hypothetical protein
MSLSRLLDLTLSLLVRIKMKIHNSFAKHLITAGVFFALGISVSQYFLNQLDHQIESFATTTKPLSDEQRYSAHRQDNSSYQSEVSMRQNTPSDIQLPEDYDDAIPEELLTNISFDDAFDNLVDLYSTQGNISSKSPEESKRLYSIIAQQIASQSGDIEKVLTTLDSNKHNAKMRNTLLSLLSSSVNDSNVDAIISFAEQQIGLLDQSSVDVYVSLINTIPEQSRKDNMHQHLVDISLDPSLNMNSKLDAIAMLSGEAIDSMQRTQLKNSLEDALIGASDTLTSMLLPQVLRFTDVSEQADLLSSILSTSSNQAQTLTILESVYANGIAINDVLSTEIQNIVASSTNLELQDAATLILSTNRE